MAAAMQASSCGRAMENQGQLQASSPKICARNRKALLNNMLAWACYHVGLPDASMLVGPPEKLN